MVIAANRGSSEIEWALLELALEQPAFGEVRVANELRKQAVRVSFRGGGSGITLRRSRSTSRRSRRGSRRTVLTDAQVAALEKSKAEQEAHGEIGMHHTRVICARRIRTTLATLRAWGICQ